MHYSEPETKRQSQQWLPRGSRAPIKAIKKPSAKKVMALVFWDKMGVLLVEYFQKGTRLTGQLYAKILGKLKNAIMEKRGELWSHGVYLLHDNASCHTSRVAVDKASELGFLSIKHPPYSPDLAPSDYHLFPKMKNFLRTWTFKDDTQLKRSTSAWLSHQPPSFFCQGIEALPYHWNKCVKVKGEYVEK